MKQFFFACLLTAVPTLLSATEPLAQPPALPAYLEPESKQDVRHRIIVAENQQSIIEEITESACLIGVGITPEKNLARIQELREFFVRAHTGLLNGDDGLGLYHGESNSRVIRSLRRVENVWGTFDAAMMSAVAEGPIAPSSYALFAEGDAELLDVLEELLANTRAAYANPNELMMSEAMTLELLGRQKLLVEKIVKDACLIVLEYDVDTMKAKLTADMALFEKTQSALLTGMPAVGLRPPPTAEIAAALQVLSDVWAEKSVLLSPAVANGQMDADTLIEFKKVNARLSEDLDAVLTLYEAL